jgi:hypothetical protein
MTATAWVNMTCCHYGLSAFAVTDSAESGPGPVGGTSRSQSAYYAPRYGHKPRAPHANEYHGARGAFLKATHDGPSSRLAFPLRFSLALFGLRPGALMPNDDSGEQWWGQPMVCPQLAGTDIGFDPQET